MSFRVQLDLIDRRSLPGGARGGVAVGRRRRLRLAPYLTPVVYLALGRFHKPRSAERDRLEQELKAAAQP